MPIIPYSVNKGSGSKKISKTKEKQMVHGE